MEPPRTAMYKVHRSFASYVVKYPRMRNTQVVLEYNMQMYSAGVLESLHIPHVWVYNCYSSVMAITRQGRHICVQCCIQTVHLCAFSS